LPKALRCKTSLPSGDKAGSNTPLLEVVRVQLSTILNNYVVSSIPYPSKQDGYRKEVQIPSRSFITGCNMKQPPGISAAIITL